MYLITILKIFLTLDIFNYYIIFAGENLIITRNNDCILSENLLERKELFIDRPYLKKELI